VTRPYFVAPFAPEDWENARSDLKIDPGWYRSLLSNRWLQISFPEPIGPILLSWVIKFGGGADVHGELYTDGQVVSLELPVVEFFLWHRAVIDAKHTLFLFSQSADSSLELKVDTDISEIQEFVAQN
jgi:hypothetical protein